ncbi:hypothetical protein LINPERHAP1_LOCUS920 [Linum perenne]
MRPP